VKKPTAEPHLTPHCEDAAFHSCVVEVSRRESNGCTVRIVLHRGARNKYYLYKYLPFVQLYNSLTATLPWRMEVRTRMLRAKGRQWPSNDNVAVAQAQPPSRDLPQFLRRRGCSPANCGLGTYRTQADIDSEESGI